MKWWFRRKALGSSWHGTSELKRIQERADVHLWHGKRLPSLKANHKHHLVPPTQGRQTWVALEHIGKEHMWVARMFWNNLHICPSLQLTEKNVQEARCLEVNSLWSLWYSQKRWLWEAALRRGKRKLWGFPTLDESLSLYFHKNLKYCLNLTRFS